MALFNCIRKYIRLEAFFMVCRNHFVYSLILGSELLGVFLPKYATCGSTMYIMWVRMDVLFDIRILKTTDHGKNWLNKRYERRVSLH